jgi:hypothetical protein
MVVFDFLAHSSFGFWIVAFLIIIFDSTLFLVPEQFTFTFGSRLNVKLRISESPYLLRHREPVVTLFVYPMTPFFISSMNEPPEGRHATKRILLQQKRAASNTRQLANLALFSLFLVCFGGPIASLQYGIERALLMIYPALYVSAVFGVGIVWFNRSIFGFATRDVAHICVELTVCPVLIVNILRRIAVRQAHPCTNDLINHFSDDHDEAVRRLKQHVEATAR